ncbi:hypothetical protein XH96_36230 [Bradyrhizobium sp. CCBAU 51765]|nr:hypothetical protein XH96_36230 [Bradyrhizobium sp. CCBAU 51765]
MSRRERKGPTTGVIPRESGESSTPRLLCILTLSLEYWVARPSRATTAGTRAASNIRGEVHDFVEQHA